MYAKITNNATNVFEIGTESINPTNMFRSCPGNEDTNPSTKCSGNASNKIPNTQMLGGGGDGGGGRGGGRSGGLSYTFIYSYIPSYALLRLRGRQQGQQGSRGSRVRILGLRSMGSRRRHH